MRIVLWLGSLLLVTSTARAHGGPPAAIGIAAGSISGPSVVVLNEGLALSRGDRWSFACPRLWGVRELASGKTPLALSSVADATWIVGANDLYAARSGSFVAQNRPDLSSSHITQLAVQRDAVYGLRIAQDGGSEIVRLGAATDGPVWRSTDHYSAIAADAEHFYLARQVTELEIVFSTVQPDGRVVEQSTLPIDRLSSQVDIRPTSRALFAVISDGSASDLYRFDGASWSRVLRGDGVLHGPLQTTDGRAWLVLNGVLMQDSADGFVAVENAPQVTCLGTSVGMPYACIGSEIYWLTSSGIGQRCFHLERLVAPDPNTVSEDAAEECQFQWTLFRNDLMRAGLSPEEWDPSFAQPVRPSTRTPEKKAPTSSGSGCHVSRLGHDAHCFPLVCIAMLAAAARRKCRWAISGALLLVYFATPCAPTRANRSGLERRAIAVATYTGGEVTIGELEDAVANMSPLAQMDAAAPEALQALLARTLQFELLALEAERRGYGGRAVVLEAVKQNSVHRLLASEVDAKLPPDLQAFDKASPSPERDALIEALVAPLRPTEQSIVRPELLGLIRLQPE